MNLKKPLGVAMVLTGLVLTSFAVEGTAHASIVPTGVKVVDWQTSLAVGVTTPKTADDVTWPQTLLTAPLPNCGGVIQEDTYKYSTTQDKATVDALIAGKVLNKPGNKTDTDSSVVISWKFTVLPTCPQACQTTTFSSTNTPSSHPEWTTEDGAPTYSTDGLVYDDSVATAPKINYFHQLGTATVPLLGIQGLSYKISETGGPQAAYDMEVDTLGTTGYTTLVWEPYNNGHTLGSPTVSDNSTYSDLEAGNWWSSHIVSGPGSQADPITLAAFDTMYPNANIISYGVAEHNAGSISTVNDITFLCGVSTFGLNTVEPVAPVVVQPVCNTTTGVVTPGKFTSPVNTADITYTVAGNVITATLATTSQFGTLPVGYVKVNATTATFTVAAFKTITCLTSVISTPTPPVSTPLAFTGTETGQTLGIGGLVLLLGLSMLGLAWRRGRRA